MDGAMEGGERYAPAIRLPRWDHWAKGEEGSNLGKLTSPFHHLLSKGLEVRHHP